MAGALTILDSGFDNPFFVKAEFFFFTFTSSTEWVASFTDIVNLVFIVIFRTRANTLVLGAQQVEICITVKAVCLLRPHTLLTALVASLT